MALKIQYPGVAQSINSDVENVAVLLRMLNLLPLQLDVRSLVNEAKRQLKREADYEQEAAHLVRYRKLVADNPPTLGAGCGARLQHPTYPCHGVCRW